MLMLRTVFEGLVLQVESPATTTLPGVESVGAAGLFTLFFLMLGPLKIIGPFAIATRGMAAGAMRALALKVVLISAVAAIAGGFIGSKILAKWHVEPSALVLAAGIVFFVVALDIVLRQYHAAPPAEPANPAVAPPPPRTMSLVFPTVLTPYGMSAVILLLSLSSGGARTQLIVGLIVAIMVLNVLGMMAARPIVRTVGPLLSILGSIIGVLQVALALQIIIAGLRGLGIVARP
jgi:multiple antibiotic resistance protein